MRTGILTHFNSWQDGYALHVGWLERAKLLQYYNQDFDFLVNENCPSDTFPNQKNNLTKPPGGLGFSGQVNFYEKLYLDVLKDYDVILTADIIYQKTFFQQNQAIRNVAERLRAKWYHWIHSAWTRRPKNLDLEGKESLKYTLPPKSKIVYMNYCDRQNVAEMFDCSVDDVLCIYNPKDIRSFTDFHPLAWEVTKMLKPWTKQAFQVFPHCATRMDAKGIDPLIKFYGNMKKKGIEVGIVFANANARKRQSEILIKKNMLNSYGLKEFEDYVFTNYFTDNAGFPRKAVSDLFRISNLFVFASWSEVNPNILLEAKISGCLCVLSNRLPCLSEFGGQDQIYFDASSKTPGITAGHKDDLQDVTYNNEQQYFDTLINKVMPRLQRKDYQWQFSYEKIWEEQFKFIFQEDGTPVSKEKIVGIMNITGEIINAPEAVADLAKHVDTMVLRYDPSIVGDVIKLCVFEASSICQVKLIKAGMGHPIEELVRALDEIKPSYFVLGMEDEKLPDTFVDLFVDFRVTNKDKVLSFDDRGARVFKWEPGIKFHNEEEPEKNLFQG